MSEMVEKKVENKEKVLEGITKVALDLPSLEIEPSYEPSYDEKGVLEEIVFRFYSNNFYYLPVHDRRAATCEEYLNSEFSPEDSQEIVNRNAFISLRRFISNGSYYIVLFDIDPEKCSEMEIDPEVVKYRLGHSSDGYKGRKIWKSKAAGLYIREL